MTDDDPVRLRHKWRNIALLSFGELLAMGVWFSGSAVLPQLAKEWHLDSAQQSWMTMSVQAGFVAGALLSALLNLADRVANRRLLAVSALLAAGFNAGIPLLEPGPSASLALRFLTGATLAGVYPSGMKLIATWCREDRGLGIGILVGALTLGSASPHLLNGLSLFGAGGMPPWRAVLVATSLMAVLGAAFGGLFVQEGPYRSCTPPFDWKFVGRALAHRPTRLANFGYLGHMWELYAMWAWAPLFLIASYGKAGWSLPGARLAGFAVIGAGALGCVLAGFAADRIGRSVVTSVSLAVSGTCAAAAGFFFDHPGLLTALCLVWGVAIVADSAQFSTAVSELTDPRYVGTALTVQTSLGFLLTMVTIRTIPPLVELFGWERVFLVLVPGPIFGIWAMLTLRRTPEAVRMASGHR